MRRLAGVGFLALAAVAIAVAVIAFTVELAPLVGGLVAFALVLIVHSGFEFYEAHRYARLAS